MEFLPSGFLKTSFLPPWREDREPSKGSLRRQKLLQKWSSFSSCGCHAGKVVVISPVSVSTTVLWKKSGYETPAQTLTNVAWEQIGGQLSVFSKKSVDRWAGFNQIKKEMLFCEHFLFAASQEGIEPPTYSLGGCRSILLSYWDIMFGICGGSNMILNRSSCKSNQTALRLYLQAAVIRLTV